MNDLSEIQTKILHDLCRGKTSFGSDRVYDRALTKLKSLKMARFNRKAWRWEILYAGLVAIGKVPAEETPPIFVTPGTLDDLGITEVQLHDMDLRTLARLAYSKGYRFTVEKDGVAPGLTISTTEASPASVQV